MCVLVRVSSGKQEPLQVLQVGRDSSQGIRGLYNHWKDWRQRGQGNYCWSSWNQNIGWEGSHCWLSVNLSTWFTGGIHSGAHATAMETNGLSFSATPKLAETTLRHRGKGILENLLTVSPCQIVETTKAPWWCWVDNRQDIIQHKNMTLKAVKHRKLFSKGLKKKHG